MTEETYTPYFVTVGGVSHEFAHYAVALSFARSYGTSVKVTMRPASMASPEEWGDWHFNNPNDDFDQWRV